jgi:tRNA A37 methylthiotransferase MiaB
MGPGVQERVNKERVDALMKLARGIEEHILQPKYGRADSLLTEVSIGRNWGGGESLKRQADGTLKFINAT